MNRLVLSIVIAVALTQFISTSIFSQASLVKDINTIPSELKPSFDYSESFCKCGGYLFFSVPGKEIWRTDGTAAGTFQLRDFKRGYDQGSGGMECANDETLFFVANDEQHGWEVWTSDGTSAGTKLVKDATPGNNDTWGMVISLGLLGDSYYFVANSDNDSQQELWKSQGTAATTVKVLDFIASRSILPVLKSDTHVFLRVINEDTQEFWSTDGTAANTIKLFEDRSFGLGIGLGDKAMFSLYNPSTLSYSLWSSDGTSSGTVMVKDFGSQYLQRFSKFNDKLIFEVNSNTWISDGTAAGTKFLTTGGADASITIDDTFYAIGYDFTINAARLLKTDGLSVETIDMYVGNSGSVRMYYTIPKINGNLFVQSFDDHIGKEPATFNLTSESFNFIKDINLGTSDSAPRSWGVLNDKVYFIADDGIHGSEIWSTDGTEAGTHLLKDIANETGNAFERTYYSDGDIVANEGTLQLLVEEQPLQKEIFTSDGTAIGTTSKFTLGFGGTLLGKAGNDLIYFAGHKFYKSNGATNDVTLFRDISNEVSSIRYGASNFYFTLGEKLVFILGSFSGSLAVGVEFWVTDGTDAGTHLLKDIYPGLESGAGYDAAQLGSKVIFQGLHPDTGSELWITDGSPNGTVMLKDINPGTAGSSPMDFAILGNKAIFGATENIHGAEVWITDGTPEGTSLLADIIPGTAGSLAKDFQATSDRVYFSVFESLKGWTLWTTDGTTAGTKMVIDVIPAINHYTYPNKLGGIDNKFYFSAEDGIHGSELWVTDGTTDGTHIIDVIPGSYGSNPIQLWNVNGVAYFKADAQLWRTNGQAAGTFKVSELEPFNLTSLDNWIYFSARHPDYGNELFKVEFTKEDQQLVFEPIEDKTFGADPFDLVISSTSPLPIQITSGDELTMAGNTATIIKPGTVAVSARQDGDALFNPAEISQSFCILPQKPTVTQAYLHTGEFVLTSSASTGNQWFNNDLEITNANEQSISTTESGTFKVNVTLDGCTSLDSDEKVIVFTAVEHLTDLLTFYPNPAQDQLHFKTSGLGQHITVSILDSQGKPMEEFQLQPGENVEHSLRDYPTGIYLLKIATPLKTSYQKFVKE